jgi:hypothetical protein
MTFYLRIDKCNFFSFCIGKFKTAIGAEQKAVNSACHGLFGHCSVVTCVKQKQNSKRMYDMLQYQTRMIGENWIEKLGVRCVQEFHPLVTSNVFQRFPVLVPLGSGKHVDKILTHSQSIFF